MIYCSSIIFLTDELGDLLTAMDQVSKEWAEQVTGKPYEAGDLTAAVDDKIKDRKKGSRGFFERKITFLALPFRNDKVLQPKLCCLEHVLPK